MAIKAVKKQVVSHPMAVNDAGRDEDALINDVEVTTHWDEEANWLHCNV